jgi:hypothetical protein
MSNEVDGRYSLSKEVRIIVFNVNTPEKKGTSLYVPSKVKRNGKEVGDARFNAQFLISDPKEIEAFKNKCAAVARAKWPGVDLNTLAKPFSAGEKEAAKGTAKGKDWSYYNGTLVVNGKSKYQPRLSIFNGPGQFTELQDAALAAAERKFYAGAWVLPQFNLVAYDPVNDGKAGVTAYLDQLTWVKDGVRLIGGQSASEAFKGYQGSVSTEDPTAGQELAEDENMTW